VLVKRPPSSTAVESIASFISLQSLIFVM
jgi:hypothetical protein